MSLYDIIRAGRVARWHANPDMAHIRETNAEHQWMVAVILLQLLPKDAAPLAEHLIFAALHHDVGEVIGDPPAALNAPTAVERLATALGSTSIDDGIEALNEVFGPDDLSVIRDGIE